MSEITQTTVRSALRERKKELAILAEYIVRQARPLLLQTLSTFPSGTDHTARHTETVERIIGMHLSSTALGVLSDDELLLLILAAHFHDLGLAGTEAENVNPTYSHVVDLWRVADWGELRW